MYLRICENIAEITAILIISTAYILCLQQFAVIDAQPAQRVSLVERRLARAPQQANARRAAYFCRAPASEMHVRRIILV
jgi:hypothetical protein